MSCATNPVWQPTVAAYLDSSTDDRLAAWWQDKRQSPKVRFANELAKSFGDHPTASYHTMLSASNLNSFFNAIMDGITDGQLSFSNEIDRVATLAIPIKDPKFPFGDIAFWLVAILAAIFASFLWQPLDMQLFWPE
ncbi:hypothetical protein EJ08DRAFT_703209 [Tothia fuscella]|uniref:Uncharacterized protein n=1 Tax=Tothia fuscella TaxID=1048955 RepID=A0A9P4TSR7_9PEZI|nr:hypothetical protein EJ08DRAFT_703209 [Tothia fuscella]